MNDIPFDYMRYQENLKREEEYRNDCRELQKKCEETKMRVQASMELTTWKTKAKQEEEERRRAFYEELSVDCEGRVIVRSCNAQVQAQPRITSNMRWPRLYIAAKASDMLETVFVLDCEIGGERKQVFLDSKKAGSATYIQKKMIAAGIDVWAPSLAKSKEYLCKFMGLMIQNAQKTVLPDAPGWMVIDGKFSFVGKERMTWKNICKMI
jgi:hypothetical protein